MAFEIAQIEEVGNNAWGVVYLVETAKAVVDSVSSGLQKGGAA
jgi:hypothetical protein